MSPRFENTTELFEKSKSISVHVESLQYNMEAEGLGQRPAAGVTTFKKRNSEKRAGLVDDKLCFYFFCRKFEKLSGFFHEKYFHSSDSKFTGTGEPLPGQLWTTTLPLPKKVEPIPMQVREKSLWFKI